MINESKYEVDFDDESELWCVFCDEKAVASFASCEEADDFVNHLKSLERATKIAMERGTKFF